MMLALLVVVVIVAGVIYVRTASFGRLLKGQVGNLLATGFRGEITLGEIDTSTVWRREGDLNRRDPSNRGFAAIWRHL